MCLNATGCILMRINVPLRQSGIFASTRSVGNFALFRRRVRQAGKAVQEVVTGKCNYELPSGIVTGNCICLEYRETGIRSGPKRTGLMGAAD